MKTITIFLTVLCLTSPASPAWADRAALHAVLSRSLGAVAVASKTFGPNESAAVVPGTLFTGFELSYPDIWDTTDTGARFCVYPGCILVAPVALPSGALVTAIELEGYDASPTNDAAVTFLANTADAFTTLATVVTAGISGHQQSRANLPAPHTVNNGKNTYTLAYTGAEGNGTRVHAVRVFYRLQVSPGPAVATYGDVPTSHVFYPFIEALAAAGITGGCGGGNYCPDAPITRGQMAAFIGRALGLHFAP